MAFEGLAGKLQAALKRLTGKGKLNEKDAKEAMREVRLALLEADVNYLVVKDFVKKITERAVGQEIMQSLTPGQQDIKIVNEELTALMGGTQSKINILPNQPTVIMMEGLQGSGKTTTAAKLAGHLKSQGRNPLLVACDIYRPAAIKQLQVVGEKVGVSVFERGQKDPVQIAKEALSLAKKEQKDIVKIDTAGRLHIDEELMDELSSLKTGVKPHEILLVVDAMTGQDAVNVAKSFDDKLGLDGVILTKLDGDTRGGAALSVKAVTGKPIKYVGTGEKLNEIEPFYPDRMASRILGMGDILTLIDRAQASIDEKNAQELEKKLRQQQFTLEDFLEQMQQLKNMGSLNDIIGMLPGVDMRRLSAAGGLDEKELVRTEAIIQSMTRQERQNPSIINASRKKRIAMGSGTRVQDVNRLLKSFEQFRKMMRQMTNIEKSIKRGRFQLPFF